MEINDIDPNTGQPTIREETTDVFVNYQLENISSDFSPLGTAIIPSDREGDFTVKLESSTDLQSWSNIIPGDFSSESNNRYFRVNIVKK